MQILRNKAWLSCVGLLIIHQILQKIFAWKVVILDNYLDAFLSIPILMGLILEERQFLINKFFGRKRQIKYHFSAIEIIVSTLFFALIFEEGFPRWSPHFTKDYWDYLAYFSGALIFYRFINPIFLKETKQ